MFEPNSHPRLFGCPPGVDFPAAVLRGLEDRLKNSPPEAWAKVTLLVNTQRMARRLRDLFDTGPARILPKVRLVTELDGLLPGAPLAPSPSALRRRLELVSLIAGLMKSQADLAAETAAFDLADSLAGLFDEMQGEGVTPDDIAQIDVTDQSGHWARAQKFISIAQAYIDTIDSAPDPEARRRATVLKLATHWAIAPPRDPILIFGSTGSRGTTQLLMQAVAHLPQGAIILPGFDFHMPAEVWATMGDAMSGEDHPQYRFVNLTDRFGMAPTNVEPWTSDLPPSDARNQLISLALRPAPVTDAWRREGPKLSGLDTATADITLVEANTPRAEAITIAMRLRAAAETGQRAALITPDRMLTRQVTAALDRWNILPDDSAGEPLHLSPPGRFLRHTAALFERPLDAEALLTLLKHPLTRSGDNRNTHALYTQWLELRIRKIGLPYPDRNSLISCAKHMAKDNPANVEAWAIWVADLVCDQNSQMRLPLRDWVERHLALSESLASGPDPSRPGTLWEKSSGEAAYTAMEELRYEAQHGGVMSASDYIALVGQLLAQGEVREPRASHGGIMIWGTLEARVQGADLVILAGLNEGTWPETPAPDPWLNRQMRLRVGLLLPERRIGLSAHDFQQAVAAREVWLTRSIRSDDAETVPSRWVNRLSNLLSGLKTKGGPEAWDEMRKRGDHWLELARQLDMKPEVERAHRPAPCPPVAARPRQFTVTEIETLIRDPYAIYAKHCLRLLPLRPLVQTPDALLRGILSHDVMEAFVKETLADSAALTTQHLMNHAKRILDKDVPWPAARTLWLARFGRVADWIVQSELKRQNIATPFAFEEVAQGILMLPSVATTLKGRADRIDVDDAGHAIVYDYKTGPPPTGKQQKHFNKQLLLEAAMIEEGAFHAVGPRAVRAATFIGIGSTPEEKNAPLEEEPPQQVIAQLVSLFASYLKEDQGYPSRRAMDLDTAERDYDQLARVGEWDSSDDPVREALK